MSNRLGEVNVLHLFIFSDDGRGFLDLLLCFFQLPPEHFLQLKRKMERPKHGERKGRVDN